MRIVMKILARHFLHDYAAFIDDVVAGGLKTDYNGEESMPSVRRYVLKHI